MWIALEPLFATSAYLMQRLWIAALVVAVIGPPAFAWLQRHRWRFTSRAVFIVVLVVSVSFVWLTPDFHRLLQYSRDPYGSLIDFECELPLCLAVLSSIFTWAAFRPKVVCQ